MQVTKVKCLGATTTVEYETMNISTPESHQLSDCPDRRRDEFAVALEGVAGIAYGITGMDGKNADRYTLTGVAVSKDQNGHRGFIFTGKYRMNAGEVAFNSPRMRAPIDGGESGATTLTEEQMERIDELLTEAIHYVTGKREQLDLGLGAEEEEEEAVN